MGRRCPGGESCRGSAGRFHVTKTFHVNRPPPPPAAPPAPAPHTPAPRRLREPGRKWARFLADVAPVDPVPHGLAKLQRDRPPVLDGQVRDAAPRVHDRRSVRIPPQERPGGAGVEAGPAASAVVAVEGGIGLHLRIQEHHPQKEVRPHPGVDQHGVPPRPPEPGALGQFPLEDRRRVHTDPPFRGARPASPHAASSSRATCFSPFVMTRW
jgi:hypothetical protein